MDEPVLLTLVQLMVPEVALFMEVMALWPAESVLAKALAVVAVPAVRLVAVPVRPVPAPLKDVALTMPDTSNFWEGLVMPIPTLPFITAKAAWPGADVPIPILEVLMTLLPFISKSPPKASVPLVTVTPPM